MKEKLFSGIASAIRLATSSILAYQWYHPTNHGLNAMDPWLHTAGDGWSLKEIKAAPRKQKGQFVYVHPRKNLNLDTTPNTHT